MQDTKLIHRTLFAFLYTKNERSEREIKEKTPFTRKSKGIKYLGINLPKEAKDLYSENCKTLMKEFENDTNKGFPGGTVVKNPPANGGDTGSSPGPQRSHMPRSNESNVPQLLSLCATATEAHTPRAHAPQQEKPPQ